MADGYNPYQGSGVPSHIPQDLHSGSWGQHLLMTQNPGENYQYQANQQFYPLGQLASHPYPHSHLYPFTTSPSSELPDYDDAARAFLPAQGSSSRIRRRVGAVGEHVKFRRTRSGCYTCRQRRVKCDEGRPTCDRCSKGNRECIYPEPSSATKSRRGSTKTISTDAEADGSSQEDDQTEPMDAADDSDAGCNSEPPSATVSTFADAARYRKPSDTSSATQDESSIPSEDVKFSKRTSPQVQKRPSVSAATKSSFSSKASKLPKDVQFYLKYARQNLSAIHYGFKYEVANFLHSTLLEVAVRFEPLLYAVVGFAAYHHAVARPDGKLSDFLGYYDRSVTALRLSLGGQREQNQRHAIATLLTMLQLATIEEYLGDWANCMAHQRAACQIIKELFTPQSMLANATLNMILNWYVRFDIFAGVMAGVGSVIGQEWIEIAHQYAQERSRQDPKNTNLLYAESWAYLRLLGVQVANLCAKGMVKDMPEEEYREEWDKVAKLIEDWEVPASLTDPSKTVRDPSEAATDDPDEFVKPYVPGLVYKDELYKTLHLQADHMGLVIMFNEQLGPVFAGKAKTGRGAELSFRLCQMIEAVHRYSGSPPEVLLSYSSLLGMCALHFPDEPARKWFCKKFAQLESLGYIIPENIRTRLSAIWETDVTDWWLPNDEGRPPILKSIRALISVRKEGPQTKMVEDIRDMRGVFSTLNVSDASSPDSNLGGMYTGGSPVDIRRSGSEVTFPKTDTESMASFGPPSATSVDLDRAFFDPNSEFSWDQPRRE